MIISLLGIGLGVFGFVYAIVDVRAGARTFVVSSLLYILGILLW